MGWPTPGFCGVALPLVPRRRVSAIPPVGTVRPRSTRGSREYRAIADLRRSLEKVHGFAPTRWGAGPWVGNRVKVSRLTSWLGSEPGTLTLHLHLPGPVVACDRAGEKSRRE